MIRDIEGAIKAAGGDAELFKVLDAQLRDRVQGNMERVAYYEGEKDIANLGIALAEIKELKSVLGWPAKAVDVLERRINLIGFQVTGSQDKDPLGLTEAFEENRLDSAGSEITRSCLIHGPAFVLVETGGDKQPVIRPFSAEAATGLWDDRGLRLKAGFTVNSRDDSGHMKSFTIWEPDRVLQAERDLDTGGWEAELVGNPAGRCSLVPFVHRARLGRLFGYSRITRQVMRLTDQAVRTLFRFEINEEFYSAPQRWAVNADVEALQAAAEEMGLSTGQMASIGKLFAVTAPRMEEDEDGKLLETKVGQFPQMTAGPHVDHLKTLTMLMAGETSIPVHYFGIVQDNPASAEAIAAAEAELVSLAERSMREFNWPWREVARLAVAASGEEVPEGVRIAPRWKDPATPTQAAMTDAVLKLVSGGVLPPDSDVALEMAGLSERQVERVKEERAISEAKQLLRQALNPAVPRQSDSDKPEGDTKLEPEGEDDEQPAG